MTSHPASTPGALYAGAPHPGAAHQQGPLTPGHLPAAEGPRPLVILGSTGSIGRQALQVAAAFPEHLKVVGLAAGSQDELLAEQVQQFQPEVVAMADADAARRLRRHLPDPRLHILSGPEGVEEVAAWPAALMVLGAMLGAAGLGPTLRALDAGKHLAIANKETLVTAGELVVETARRRGAALLPVDSEHSALAQCLVGEDPARVERLTLTASGGPFVELSRAELAQVKPEAALRHPNWDMGAKITIDSATLMNKALESIEAQWLFHIPLKRIDVVVHRQSIVHSFVTFCDGSVKAQMGVPDMRLPIQWALLYPQRLPGPAPALDLASMGPLTFAPPDEERFPALPLARHCMELGGTAPAVMNAANEIAVQAYLTEQTTFYGITDCVTAVLERHRRVERPCLQEIQEADAWARRQAAIWLNTAPARISVPSSGSK